MRLASPLAGVLAVLTGVVSLLLAAQLIPTGIWRDEATSIFEAARPGIAEVLARVRVSEINPPLFFVLLHGWIRLVGTAPDRLKMLPLAFDAAMLGVVFVLAARAAGPAAGVLAVAFTGANPTVATYATELRPYAAASLFCTLAVLAAIRWLERPERSTLALGALAVVALIFTSYVGFVVAGTLAIAGLLVLGWTRRAALFVGVVSLVPLVVCAPLYGLERVQSSSNLISHTFAWSYRPVLFLVRVAQALPLRVAGERGKLDDLAGVLTLLVLLVAAWRSFVNMRAGAGRERDVATIVSTIVFIGVAAGLSVLSLATERYLEPVVPLAACAFALVAVRIGERVLAAAPGATARIAVAAAVLLGAVPLASEAARLHALAREPKSAMAAVAAAFPAADDPGLAIVVAPDWAAQTLAFDEGTTRGIHGFVRWDDPDVFDLRGYVALWSNPRAVDHGLAEIDDLARHGTRRLVLVEMQPVSRDPDPVYDLSARLLRAVERRYRLVARVAFPARAEPAVAYEFVIPANAAAHPPR